MGTITQHEQGVRRIAEADGGAAAHPAGHPARRVKKAAGSAAARREADRRPDTGWTAVPLAPTRPRKALPADADKADAMAEAAKSRRIPADGPAGSRTPAPPPEPVTVAGRYRLGRRMGIGGASAVYQATDLRLDRPVAVKVLTEEEQAAECADRFLAESSLHAGLHHPRLVPLLDAGRDDDGHGYLVMPLVDGPNLAQVVRSGPMDPREVRRIGAELADALAYVHAHDVVHRDVKPANVLLDRSGRVYLADFGAAHAPGAPPLVPPGMVIGTAGYLAPEQALGEEVSSACDVFALGLVLLEALTGRPEYTGTVLERAAAAVTRPPRIAEETVGAEWASVLRSLTAREPDQRPDSGLVRTMLRAEGGGRSGASAVASVAGGMRVRGTVGPVAVPVPVPAAVQPAPEAAPEAARKRAMAGLMRVRAA